MLNGKRICKSFTQESEPPAQVLFDLDLEIPTGDFVAITGRSGSGKSTLLYILSSLDQPTSGQLLIDGIDLVQMTSEEVHVFRNEKMGFIFQFHYLLPELTALENVLMPARKTGRQKELHSRGVELLERVGLESKLRQLPKQLSGGEQQRVAIARALVMSPKYLFADEPTGSLDSVNGNIVMQILEDVSKTGETTVIYVTHDREFAARARHRVELSDGRITADART